MLGSSRTSRLRSRGIDLVQVGEEVIGRLVHGHLAAGNVLVDFPLTPLPLFGPEPRLIGRHWQCRAQLDYTVTALEDLDLRARLIQMHPAAKLARQCDESAGLQSDVAMKSHTPTMPVQQISCNTSQLIYRPSVHRMPNDRAGGRVRDPPYGGRLPSSGSFAILAGFSWELSSGDRSSRVVVDPERSQGRADRVGRGLRGAVAACGAPRSPAHQAGSSFCRPVAGVGRSDGLRWH